MALSKTHLEKYADVLIWGLETGRTKKYRPYDVINIRYDLDALPLAEILHRKLIQKKMIVILRGLSTPVVEKDFFDFSDKKQRSFIGAWENSYMESLNGNIFLSAPASLTHLKQVDPKKINDVAITRKKLRKVLEKREEEGKFSWTLCTMPTEELARQAKLSLKEYTKQIIKACYLNTPDPVEKWEEIYKNSNEIKKWLNSLPIKKIHLESDSSDLTVSLGEKRRFLGVSGHNIPSFEIFTSPDWRGTEGVYFANLPSFRSGNYVTSVKLEFEKGNVVRARAGKGENFLNQMVKMDKGSGRIGEFSLTDKRFSKIDCFMADTLFDENFGGNNGNSHIAIGTSYSDTYKGDTSKLTSQMKKDLGFNDSALHWDLVNTEDKVVTALLKNGKQITLYEKGMFSY
jgi:aminopeptidase